jgi:small neutral amino acid transporter SnatA (MarC family)
MSGWQNLWAIVSVPDNIPIVFMIVLVSFFTWLSFHESNKNDRLIGEGRKEQVLRRMQD